MKVVAFNGSPRKGGNTEQMIEQVFDVLRKHDIECTRIDIAQQALRGCMACGGCKANGGSCVQKDDLNDWFGQASAADAVIIGSPTYFADVTAETKALLDRMGYMARVTGTWNRKPFAAIVAARRGGAVVAYDTINHMAQINQMFIVGSTYWNFGLGRDKGEVTQDEEGMANMQNLGENMAWLLKKLNN